MVLQKQNGSYYRVRVLKEELHRVKIGVSSPVYSSDSRGCLSLAYGLAFQRCL